MSKSLLLDIDGVIVRDRLLLAHVRDNCTAYVRHKFPDCKDPQFLNRSLYLAHGHTGRGLEITCKQNVNDFNSFVYDKQLLSHLGDVIYGDEFQEEADEIHSWTNKWDITLFTNSPSEWAIPVARAIGNNINLVCGTLDSPLKPHLNAYRRFPSNQIHTYVDDSLKNIGTTRWLNNWRPIYFTENDEPSTFCPTIGSIWELGLYLNSN
jgi:FMN phosphatase YigB (HAD superfamily)